jgi:rubrerythrin
MVEVKIDELRGLLEKATPGHWYSYQHFATPTPQLWEIKGASRDDDIADCLSADDAAFVCHLKHALPSLLDQLEQARREVERLTGLLESLTCHICGDHLSVGPGGFDCPSCNPNPARAT